MAESWEMTGRERRYSIPALANSSAGSYRETMTNTNTNTNTHTVSNTAEDLHAWSIYRQNLNSDFADSALGSNFKAPLPYGNFQLDSHTIQSIMTHPKCGPKSGLAHNTSAYLKFGLPRVVARSGKEESSGYDSSNDGSPVLRSKNPLSRSDPDFRKHLIHNPAGPVADRSRREKRLKSVSEANLLATTTKCKIFQPNTKSIPNQFKFIYLTRYNAGLGTVTFFVPLPRYRYFVFFSRFYLGSGTTAVHFKMHCGTGTFCGT